MVSFSDRGGPRPIRLRSSDSVAVTESILRRASTLVQTAAMMVQTNQPSAGIFGRDAAIHLRWVRLNVW